MSAELPPAKPLLCRVFGHRLVTVPLYQINPTRWVQPVTIPTRTFCRRCRWEADRD